jgi:site-specific DNA-methyltransferase (adenine-specific)
MNLSPMETIFNVFNETTDILKDELSCTYLEGLAETGENLFHEDVLQEELSEITKKRLKKIYDELKITNYTNEEIRKAYQLVILKGMKDSVQPNHQMTPDSIGLVIGYLIKKFYEKVPTFTLLDPAVGTGNLLTTILNHLSPKEVNAFAVDIDDLLLKLAYIGANLQKHPIEFLNQDTLHSLFVDPVDAVVCDLPVGYYPNDMGAESYQLKADQGHSFAHHLFIEQSIKHTKSGGYLFFLIPNDLFDSKEAPKLHAFLQEHVYIQGILQLPLSIFKNQQAAKSILILQKKAIEVEAPKQVLIATLPSLSNQQAMENIIQKIEKWFSENK